MTSCWARRSFSHSPSTGSVPRPTRPDGFTGCSRPPGRRCAGLPVDDDEATVVIREDRVDPAADRDPADDGLHRDLDLSRRELLAGHGVGAGPGPAWPEDLLPALPTRAFRGELRDLLMRAVELGLDPDGLAALGAVHSRPEWEAAAKVFAEYDEVTALAPATSAALDPAAVLGTAANHLLTDRASLDLLRREVRLVVVDDAQELTPAALRLLEVLVGEGAVDLILLGDPDAATQTFRGADPSLFVTAWPAARSHRLDRSHRCPPAVTAAAARVAVRTRHWSGVSSPAAQREATTSTATVDLPDPGAPRTRRTPSCRTCCCLLYTSPSPRDRTRSRMPSSA